MTDPTPTPVSPLPEDRPAAAHVEVYAIHDLGVTVELQAPVRCGSGSDDAFLALAHMVLRPLPKAFKGDVWSHEQAEIEETDGRWFEVDEEDLAVWLPSETLLFVRPAAAPPSPPTDKSFSPAPAPVSPPTTERDECERLFEYGDRCRAPRDAPLHQWNSDLFSHAFVVAPSPVGPEGDEPSKTGLRCPDCQAPDAECFEDSRNHYHRCVSCGRTDVFKGSPPASLVEEAAPTMRERIERLGLLEEAGRVIADVREQVSTLLPEVELLRSERDDARAEVQLQQAFEDGLRAGIEAAIVTAEGDFRFGLARQLRAILAETEDD